MAQVAAEQRVALLPCPIKGSKRKNQSMTRKISVVIECDEDGCYAWCPELKCCHSQGSTVEKPLIHIQEAAKPFLETLTDEEKLAPTHQVVLTTAIEAHA